MSFLKRIARAVRNPRVFLAYPFNMLCRKWMSDELYLTTLYRLRTGTKLDLTNPTTFNEKLNWLKVYYHNPTLTKMADKYEVKKIVADKIGKEYVVENYGVYNKWEDINFSSLPNKFVIKCTHDSGGAFICKNKKSFDYAGVEKVIKKNQRNNFYFGLREWPYKNIKPRIIVDRFLDDHTGIVLRDYKFWCFNGVPTFMYITIKGKDVFENFYDMQFNPVDINHGFPRHVPEFDPPQNFELMKELASKLSQDIPFVRVDFFDVDNHVFFGEFTFFDWGGFWPFKPREMDIKLGQLLTLPEKML